ncbi:IS701 family transposase [Schinkia azotoformans]|uniref:IS701 family transposase n=1 Tax=Schinkia azotoformans TaxID=1454 RepID=UPI002DB838DF|nr:IS701 family transposase [Schinkia azotoformans]MEC1721124.1 IS701 family transposase [Schinkia azotoformans]MED4355124.1 IS701 family transposase [Schinkia azotoformans]MED4412375.1 IS701 family transposase [Schinkia azotoformans]
MVTFYSHIVNFILALQPQISKPQMNHMLTFMHGIILTDGRINVPQIRRSTSENRDLSCMTRFLNESLWCPNRVTRRRLQFVMNHIQKSRSETGDTRPIVFFIVDDTQCKKDCTTKRMEGLDNHYYHSDGKTIWSHCVVTAHVVSENNSFAWDFRSYFQKLYCQKEGISFKSKNDLTIELINSYPVSDDDQVYVLVDSWYTSKKLIETCYQKGFHPIGGLRTNRKIYPAGVGIKISDLASTYIESTDLRPVTVNGHTYKIYTYEGNLSDTDYAKVLLSWENKFDSSKTPFCLHCTDSSLNLVTILSYYNVLRNIETGYRYFKELLGFDEYQLLSYKGMERFWCIEFLTYNYVEYQRQTWQKELPLRISDVVWRIRKDHLCQLVVYGYEQALSKKSLMDVLKDLKLAV